MNWKSKSIIIAAVLIFVLSGCGIEEAIEDLTTRSVTLSQTVFDGEPEKTVTMATMIENRVYGVSDSGSVVNTDLTDISDAIIVYGEAFSPAQVVLNGQITNFTGLGTQFGLYIADADSDDAQTKLGSTFLQPGTVLKIQNNSGFDQSAQQVEAALYDFFSSNPGISNAELIVTIEGHQGCGVRIDWLKLSASPVYRNIRPMSSEAIGGYGDNIKSIGQVSLEGTIENFGDTQVRFLLVVGEINQAPDFDNLLICDGYVAPGEKVQASSLLVANGLARTKNIMYDAIDGANIQSNVFLISDGDISAIVDNLEIETEVTVGL